MERLNILNNALYALEQRWNVLYSVLEVKDNVLRVKKANELCNFYKPL